MIYLLYNDAKGKGDDLHALIFRYPTQLMQRKYFLPLYQQHRQNLLLFLVLLLLEHHHAAKGKLRSSHIRVAIVADVGRGVEVSSNSDYYPELAIRVRSR